MSDLTNPIITQAIFQACDQHGQDANVAKKICAWVEASFKHDIEAAEMQDFARIVISSISLRD